MSEREEKRREEEYPYTDIRIRRKNRITFYVSKNEKRDIYIPMELLPTFKKLRELLKGEGITLSEWIRQNALDYVRLHEPGNPQRLLTTFTNQLKQADPFGCGQLVAVDVSNRWVRCKLSKTKIARNYCMNTCALRRIT